MLPRVHFLIGYIAIGIAALLSSQSISAAQVDAEADVQETRVPVEGASLYARVTGSGQPVIVLHGGPDFDHAYLLPDLDRLKDAFRLVYYDQRGRGRSADGVRPENVSLASDIDDIDRVRQHFALEAPILLGHSWGTVLALEYAARYPDRVSALILMNPAPASANDLGLLKKSFAEKLGADLGRQREIISSAAYQAGDPETVAARYRIHFQAALAQRAHYESLMAAMRRQFISQGSEGILKARAVEDRLMLDTWQLPGYDLLARVRSLRLKTLVIVGEQDFIPVQIAEQIARTIPGAKLTTIKNCGHFAYLECPKEVRAAIDRHIRPDASRRK